MGRRSQVVIEMTGTIPFGVGQDGDDRRLTLAILPVQEQDRQGPSFEGLPTDCPDGATDELGIVFALVTSGTTHDLSPNFPSKSP